MSQTLYHFGGEGDALHIALANGFPPQTYTPLLAPMTSAYEVFSYVPRALWEPAPDPQTAPNWQVMGQDILRGLSEREGVIAIGHSMGGVGTLIAAASDPARFRAVILLDPVILPPWVHRAVAIARPLGFFRRNHMVKGALNRKAHFASPEEAFAYWRNKALFRDWSDEVLEHYVDGLLVQKSPGDPYHLRWSPAWEAHYFGTFETTTWHWLRKLKDQMPILVIRGGTSRTFLQVAANRVSQTLPNVTLATIPGHGHLFPQSAPEQTRQEIETWLQKVL